MKPVKSLLAGLGDCPVRVVDTAPIICWLEGHPRLAERFAPVFNAAAASNAAIAISTVTLAKVLAGPLRAGNELLTAQYREALTRGAGWRVLSLDVEAAVAAARMRVTYKLRLPAAIQVATAIRAGAVALVTHDRALRGRASRRPRTAGMMGSHRVSESNLEIGDAAGHRSYDVHELEAEWNLRGQCGAGTRSAPPRSLSSASGTKDGCSVQRLIETEPSVRWCRGRIPE